MSWKWPILVLLMVVLIGAFAVTSLRQRDSPLVGSDSDSLDSKEIYLGGQRFSLYRVEKIDYGWAAYYSPYPGNNNPDTSDQSVIVNYYLPTYNENDVVSAELIASMIKQQALDEGAELVSPFTSPDTTNPNQSAFFIPMYKNFGTDAEIYITKVAQVDNRAYSILYKQRFYGNTFAELDQQVNDWFIENIEVYGNSLASLSLDDSWFKKVMGTN